MEKNKLITKAFKIIEKKGWDKFTLAELALEEKISLLNLKKVFNSKNSVLVHFSKMIDNRVEETIDIEDLKNSSVKDNIFELFMIRFEAMLPYRKTLKEIFKSKKLDPIILKEISKNIINSLDFYLEISNAYSDNYFDFIKKNVTFLIYGYVFKEWLNDDTEDLSKTMSKLDNVLTYSEKMLNKINSLLAV